MRCVHNALRNFRDINLSHPNKKKIQNSFYKIERTNGVLGISILHGGKQKNGWCPKRCGRDCIYMLNFLEEG